MKFLKGLTLAFGLTVVTAPVAEAYTWQRNDFRTSGVGSLYDGRNFSSFASSDSGTSNGHSYLNYGSIGSVGGAGRVSLPRSGPIHNYNDEGNDRTITIPVLNPAAPSGNFGKATNRGPSRRFY